MAINFAKYMSQPEPNQGQNGPVNPTVDSNYTKPGVPDFAGIHFSSYMDNADYPKLLNDTQQTMLNMPQEVNQMSTNLNSPIAQQPMNQANLFNQSQQTMQNIPQESQNIGNVPMTAQNIQNFNQRTNLPGRNLPVIGPVLKGLDWFGKTPVQHAIANIGQAFYVPGATGAGIEGLANAAESGVSKLLPNLASNTVGKVAQKGLSGAATGGVLGAGQGLTQTGTLKGAKEGAISGAVLGGTADAAIGAVSPIVKSALSKLRTKGNAHAVDQLLALPEPKQRGNENTAQTPDIIAGKGNIEQPALPSPQLGEPTKAKLKPNIYRQKFENLIQTANELQQNPNTSFRPGYEHEQLQSLWSQMAGPKDPGLDKLIELAYPKGTKIFPDLVNAAKENQLKRQKYGIPLPVKTIADRYNPEINQAAMPETKMNITGNIKPYTNIEPMTSQETPLQTNLKQQNEPNIPTNLQTPVNGNKSGLLSDIKNAYQNEQSQGLGISALGRDTKPLSGTKTQIVSKTQRDPFILSDKVTNAYIKNVDNLHALNQFDKSYEKVTGKKLTDAQKTHVLALNSRGSNMIAHQITFDHMVNMNGDVVGQSLKDIIKQIPRRKYKDFIDYLTNKHAITRMDRGEKVYNDNLKMTPEKLTKQVNQYEQHNPEFTKVAQQYYDFNNQLSKTWLVDTGIISPKEWQSYLDKNPFYVPMNRKFTEIERQKMFGGKKGYANQTNPVKKVSKFGSQRKIYDPIDSTIEHVDQFVKAAKRNQVMQTLIRNLKNNPEDLQSFAELLPDSANVSQSGLKNINEILNNEGVGGLVDHFNEQFDHMLNQSQKLKPKTDNVVNGLIDGEKVPIKINDPHLFDALTNLTPQAQGEFLKAIGNVTRMMKVLTTGVNPVFSLTRNIFRDIPTAYINSKSTNNQFTFAKDLVSSIIDVIGNRESYQSFKNMGGGHSSAVAADRNMLAQSKNKLLPARNLAEQAGKMVRGGIHRLENLNNALESAPRLAEYKRITRQGGNSLESKISGLHAANDVTVNFNRYGNVGKQIDAVFPYYNAAIQGLDKTVRAYKDNPIQATIKSVAAITIPTIALYAINHNNPNYQKLSKYIKDNYFLFPLPDGKFLKIAKPREIGTVFSDLVERSLQQWKQHDPSAFQQFATTMINNFSPPGIQSSLNDMSQHQFPNPIQDTIAGPVTSLSSNKNFAGIPIVPGYLQNVSPQYQYDNHTSEIAKFLGSKLKYSPKKIDYLIKSYGGVLGQLGIPADTKGSTIKDTLQRQVLADPTYSNDIISNFYNNKSKYDTAHADYNQTGIKGKNFNEPVRRIYDHAGTIIGKIRKEMRSIESNSSLPDQQKQDQLKRLQQVMVDFTKRVNDYVQKGGKP